MPIVLRELRDPVGLGLALLTAVVNLAIGVRAGLALVAGLAVLGVRVIAGITWPVPRKTLPIEPNGRLSALSRREMQVAELVSEGLTNREVGRRLFVEERTVDAHLQHIHNKTGLKNRAELSAEVARSHANRNKH